MNENIKTISEKEVKDCDIIFYRPTSFFGRSIVFYDAFVHIFRPKTLWRILTKKGFSHVAAAIKNSKKEIRRFDACEGYKTGFRNKFGQCYVFRLDMDIVQKKLFKKHLISRTGSKYDRKGIGSFVFPALFDEDEFCDYCSELIKNGLLLTRNYDELLGVQLTPLQLYTALRPKLTFIGLLLR